MNWRKRKKEIHFVFFLLVTTELRDRIPGIPCTPVRTRSQKSTSPKGLSEEAPVKVLVGKLGLLERVGQHCSRWHSVRRSGEYQAAGAVSEAPGQAWQEGVKGWGKLTATLKTVRLLLLPDSGICI